MNTPLASLLVFAFAGLNGSLRTASVSNNLAYLSPSILPQEESPKPQSYPFDRYSVQRVYKGQPAQPKLITPEQRGFRTVLRNGARKGANFAGHYTIVEWGCGSNCVAFAVIDAINGKVYDRDLPEMDDQYPCGLLYKARSTLLVVEKSPTLTADCEALLYNWDGSRFVPVPAK